MVPQSKYMLLLLKDRKKSSDSEFREESNQNLAKDLMADRYFLMKNNKITAEDQYKDKPGKTYSKRNAFMVGNTKWLVTCLSSARHECITWRTHSVRAQMG